MATDRVTDIWGARTRARLLLHAFALTLPWPSRGAEPLSFTAPPPAEFLAGAAVLGLGDLAGAAERA